MTEHQERLTATAVRAVTDAADTLGIDPAALAGWLSGNHRLTRLLLLLGRPAALEERRADLEGALEELRTFVARAQEQRQNSPVEVVEWHHEWL